MHSRTAPVPPPAAVLFDMDGTLVDTEHLWWRAVAEVAERLGYRLSDADLPEVLGCPVAHTAGYLCRTTGAAVPEARIARGLDDAFASRVAGDVTPRPGVLRLLAGLRAAAVPTGLVTASPRRIVDLVLDRLGADWFTLTVAAEDTARAKPAPDPYLTAAERLGVEPGDCVAVEDSPPGLASARAAGCRVVAVPSTVPIPPGDGVMVVGSLEEVDLTLLSAFAAARA
ncbi:HAD family hydrolase [Actinacidiphila yeochonensis]|uniref:HAD family hydrolase n=1 Tax=Actinacidiphila yeochonensis TaxID=89050 RepID=UPI00056A764A|nr:HAD family phosphatase [Actinacidiphila yeochonensis]